MYSRELEEQVKKVKTGIAAEIVVSLIRTIIEEDIESEIIVRSERTVEEMDCNMYRRYMDIKNIVRSKDRRMKNLEIVLDRHDKAQGIM